MWAGILALVIALVSVVLAIIGHSAGNPLWLMSLAIFIALFTGARWPLR
jgi:hypothetical protein